MKGQVWLGLRVCTRGRSFVVGILDAVGKDSCRPIARLTLPPRPWEGIEAVAGVSWAVKNKGRVSWPCSESRFSFPCGLLALDVSLRLSCPSLSLRLRQIGGWRSRIWTKMPSEKDSAAAAAAKEDGIIVISCSGSGFYFARCCFRRPASKRAAMK